MTGHSNHASSPLGQPGHAKPASHPAIRWPFAWLGAVVSCLGVAAFAFGVAMGVHDPHSRAFWSAVLTLPLTALIARWFVRLLWRARGGTVASPSLSISFGPRLVVGPAVLAFALAGILPANRSTFDWIGAALLAGWGLAILLHARGETADAGAPPPPSA